MGFISWLTDKVFGPSTETLVYNELKNLVPERMRACDSYVTANRCCAFLRNRITSSNISASQKTELITLAEEYLSRFNPMTDDYIEPVPEAPRPRRRRRREEVVEETIETPTRDYQYAQIDEVVLPTTQTAPERSYSSVNEVPITIPAATTERTREIDPTEGITPELIQSSMRQYNDASTVDELVDRLSPTQSNPDIDSRIRAHIEQTLNRMLLRNQVLSTIINTNGQARHFYYLTNSSRASAYFREIRGAELRRVPANSQPAVRVIPVVRQGEFNRPQRIGSDNRLTAEEMAMLRGEVSASRRQPRAGQTAFTPVDDEPVQEDVDVENPPTRTYL